MTDITPTTFPKDSLDKTAPIYILDTLYKDNASLRITSKIKKSRIKFRSYDPKEQPRLSTLEAYRNVNKSAGVIINLLSSIATDYQANNLRGAFLAGLSYGLEKEVLILQQGDEPVPVDYRDFVSIYKYPKEVDKYINEFVPAVTEVLQEGEIEQIHAIQGLLAKIDLGSPAAENEMSNLGNYYVETDEFNQALSGSVRLAVGRKGSGKTALFFQVRDYIRRNRKNVVLDLKPEGHQLQRFKYVLKLLGEGVLEHTASAFWEYILLLEICHKLLQKDALLHKRDHILYLPYRRLLDFYAKDPFVEEVDFSERMFELVNRIKDDFEDRYELLEQQYLSPGLVNALIYKHDIQELRKQLVDYLKFKEGVWILFDNIDKSWPTRGLDKIDIVVLRSLLDSTENIEHFFRRNGIPTVTIIFVRNDVYELLVDESPDRGKDSKVSLDWSDPDRLKEIVRRRLVYSGLDNSLTFQELWRTICVSHIDGEDSSDYIINRSLMRPRNFITLVNYCKANAVNLQHTKINEEDIIKACSTHSKDILNEIGLEIRDVFPQAEDILYYFIDAPQTLTVRQVKKYFKNTPVDPQKYNQLLEILLWFGFLGVRNYKGTLIEDRYIYDIDIYYDMKKLRRLSHDFKNEDLELSINVGFLPFLEIGKS